MSSGDFLRHHGGRAPDQMGAVTCTIVPAECAGDERFMGVLAKRKSRSPELVDSDPKAVHLSRTRRVPERVEAVAAIHGGTNHTEPKNLPYKGSKGDGQEGATLRLIPTRHGRPHESLRPAATGSWPRPGFGVATHSHLNSVSHTPRHSDDRDEVMTGFGSDNIQAVRENVLQTNSPGTGDDGMYEIKIRKPYTITKQRERWTDEEHQRFLEALKTHGRKWGKIADHIGTKTAVQIRSHAQKFFSRLEREKQSGNTSEELHIPPPRPKRKPPHPYPRKAPTPAVAASSPSTAPTDATATETEEIANGTSVAAVAAAACAAAAAAAAAVVAAAGQDVRAQLQASPPPGFPFFGCPPVELEKQARESVWSQSKNLTRKTADLAMPLTAEKPATRKSKMEDDIGGPVRKRLRSVEKSLVMSDGDSACSHELSDQGEYEEQLNAHLRKQAPSLTPTPTSAAMPQGSTAQLFSKTAEALAWPPPYSFATPMGMEAVAARIQQQFPNSWQPPFYPPPGPKPKAPTARDAEPVEQRLGLGGPERPSFGKHGKMVQQQLRDSRKRSASANALFARFGVKCGGEAAEEAARRQVFNPHHDVLSPTHRKGSPDSGHELREPTSPSVHEATLKAPSQVTTQTQTGSGSDTMGSGQQGGKVGLDGVVQLKDSSASIAGIGSEPYRAAPLTVFASTGKPGRSSGAGSNGNGYGAGFSGAGRRGAEGSSQAGSGGNGGSGGSHAGNGHGGRNSDEEERSSSEPDDAQRRHAAPKFHHPSQEQLPRAPQPPPPMMSAGSWLHHFATPAHHHHHHLAQLQAYHSAAHQDALMQSYMEAYNMQYMNAAMAARYMSSGGGGEKDSASPRPLTPMTFPDPWAKPRRSREPAQE